tara:strand:- start:521 stop:1297 length:777 start_codon:yes stop_codon:yes gene_type:complete
MQLLLSLPNNKEIVVEEFLYKHIRELVLQSGMPGKKLQLLERFIVTENLNVVEKFITLVKLRERCISPTCNFYLDNRSTDVSLQYVLESFEEIIDIRETVKHENFELILDYPTRFCTASDNLMSVIREIKIDDKYINLDLLPDDEFIQIIHNLPSDILNVILQFIKDKADAFAFPLLHKHKETPYINFLNRSAFVFLDDMYCCMSESNIREYLFVLSRRIRDVNFILNSTFLDVSDYLDLYKKENEEENDKLKNKSSS